MPHPRSNQTLRKNGVNAQFESPSQLPPARVALDEAGTPNQDNLSPEQQELLAKLQDAERSRQENVAKIRESNCAKARASLETFNQGRRLRVNTADGSQRIVTEEERVERIAAAQQGYCRELLKTAKDRKRTSNKAATERLLSAPSAIDQCIAQH